MVPEPKKKATAASSRPANSYSRTTNSTTTSTSKTNIPNTLERPIHSPPDPTEHGLSDDIPEVTRSLPYAGKRSTRALLARGLPPISSLDDIFDDMTGQALNLGFDKVLEHLGEKPLRVVTVCSGTESPLLALEMLQKTLKVKFGKAFNVKHLFSAEIVPFKQAYIERNFHPQFLFRDVAELKNRVAQTAYGSIEKIPKDPDILVAGFSCVDFSVLNNNRKTLDEKGESGGTFWGIIRYAVSYKPRLVVLENIKNAPWDEIKTKWNEIGYFAIHMAVDTKAYYLPQTRERGYMFCVRREMLEKCGLQESDMQMWIAMFAGFKRPASSPAGMFLMDNDDRRLEQIEKDMTAYIPSPSSAKTPISWERYQVRHQGYRLERNLGHKRPISRSQEDGMCQMPDFSWQAYVKSLPERVWDTIDNNFLRKLGENGYDMNYKERCIDLSQGLDRETDSRAYGLVGCITPCGIPYITTRGGPLCGLEALALQGLPLNRLLLTRERHREIQDLAGNAMSSTVVGAAVLSALIVGYKTLETGRWQCSIGSSTPKRKQIITRNDCTLLPSILLSSHVANIDIASLQTRAAQGARYCVCERQTAIKQNILRCVLCDHTSCADCGGNPTHEYERWSTLIRFQPLDFVSYLKDTLPTRLVFFGISREDYHIFNNSSKFHCPLPVWNDFLDAVSLANGDELRFLDIKRSENWTVVYEGRYSILHFVISPVGTQWLLFAKPRVNDPALCLNREILSKPIGRMTPNCGLLDGPWNVCTPISSRCTFTFTGVGKKVISYESRCGLQMEKFINSQRWSQIEIQASDEDVKDFELDIRGTYELLSECGTANASLHKRAAIADAPAVYLFLDPHKINEAENDSFVFSLEHWRIPGYETRLTVAEVSHKWRSSRATEEPEQVNVYYRQWTASQKARLGIYNSGTPITCASLSPETRLSLKSTDCRDATVTLLSFSASVEVINPTVTKGLWETIDPIESPDILKEFSWLVQKAVVSSEFQEWAPVINLESNENKCDVCAPPKPRILWGRSRKGCIQAYEDPCDASLYERQIKAKPSPFLVFRRASEHGNVGCLLITLNIQTLLHQARDKLVLNTNDNRSISFFWRLLPNAYDTRHFVFPAFKLTNNKHDPLSQQPPRFRLALRPEQLRSLSWMISQESDNVELFEEEETEEAYLPLLTWRAEARATTNKAIRGGVLADDVGYGKTAIVLGLIDTQTETAMCSRQILKEGLITAKATLIVVPHIMLHQWKSEIGKFLGGGYKVLVLQSAACFAKKTIGDFRNADIILVSWSVVNNAGYYQKMHKFTGIPRVPNRAGRNFDHWFENAQVTLRNNIRTLATEGPNALLKAIRGKREEVRLAQANYTYTPSIRLRGKEYAKANQSNSDSTHEFHYADISDAEESFKAEDEYPETRRSKFDRYLNRAQSAAGNPEAALDEGQTKHEDSSTEQPTRKDKSCHKKRKHAENEDENEEDVSHEPRTWNDRKEFNIGKTDTQDWESIKTPLLHAFKFNRLVIDEFTYANPERLAPLLSLEARSKWVLSGTPPLNDFADVNTIAPFLGAHLGVDDEYETQSQNKRLKVIRKNRSEAEAFQSFKAPHSEAWHRRRHEVAQHFLDRFARKNVAEIDEIPCSQHIILVDQSPAERAIYLELYKQLMTQNRQLRRRKHGRFANDQIERLDEIIVSSSTPEEALLKRCSSLAVQGRWDDGKPEVVTCETLLSIREKQLGTLVDDIMDRLKKAAWIYCACDLKYEAFHKFAESLIRHDFGDSTVTGQAYPLLKKAVFSSTHTDWKLFFSDPRHEENSDEVNGVSQNTELDPTSNDVTDNDEQKKKPEKPSKKPRKGALRKKPTQNESNPILLPKPRKPHEYELLLRTETSSLRNLIVEWVLRERALRFLETVRLIQTGMKIPECASCEAKPENHDDMNVLGSCGHAICKACAWTTIQREECTANGCRGSGKRFNVIKANTLGHDRVDKSSACGGSKLDKLVHIIHSIPRDECALLFIQFPDLMQVASKALDSADIKHTVISPTDRRSASKVEQFQKTSFGDNRVLVLNLGGEMAAGLNLQCANHVIFLSPLLGQTQYDYDSCMTQAIGRCRRYGQTRHVHVYHLLAKLTIDVNIFQERRDKILIEKDGEPVFVSREDAMEGEGISCEGPSLVVDNAF